MPKKTFYIVAFHAVCWLLVALPAVVFVPGHIRQTTAMYLIRLCLPCFICAVFYLNYLWLVPRYFIHRRFVVYACLNLLFMVTFSLSMDWLMDLMHSMESVRGKDPRPHHEEVSGMMLLLFNFFRKVFPFILSAALATSLRLALRWNEAETARREMEIQKTEAELNNLRNQINPHFLLNTLNNIYALISFDTDKAQRAVLSLSALLRQMLYGGRENSVSLKREADFIRNYVDLMKLRSGKNVKIDFNADVPADDKIRVAPFIFISLVENAFKHGISTTEPSFVSINISHCDGRILCDIRNSNHPKGSIDKSGHGIGLEQVSKRLNLAYPGKYEWVITTEAQDKVYHSKIIIYDTEMRDN